MGMSERMLPESFYTPIDGSPSGFFSKQLLVLADARSK